MLLSAKVAVVLDGGLEEFEMSVRRYGLTSLPWVLHLLGIHRLKRADNGEILLKYFNRVDAANGGGYR